MEKVQEIYDQLLGRLDKKNTEDDGRRCLRALEVSLLNAVADGEFPVEKLYRLIDEGYDFSFVNVITEYVITGKLPLTVLEKVILQGRLVYPVVWKKIVSGELPLSLISTMIEAGCSFTPLATKFIVEKKVTNALSEALSAAVRNAFERYGDRFDFSACSELKSSCS